MCLARAMLVQLLQLFFTAPKPEELLAPFDHLVSSETYPLQGLLIQRYRLILLFTPRYQSCASSTHMAALQARLLRLLHPVSDTVKNL